MFLFSWSSFSQENKVKKGNEKYSQAAFIDAIDIYKKVAESGYRSAELFERLGNVYYFNANYKEASKWYNELFKENTTLEAIHYLRHSQSLLSVGEQQKAKEKYEQFLNLTRNDEKISLDAHEQLLKASGRYHLTPLEINSSGVDFGNTIVDNKFVFASTRDTISMFKRISAWDGLAFMDLYEAKMKGDSIIGKPVKLKGSVNTKYHETTPAFTKDGKTMYFTRNNKTPDGKSNPKYIRLKIYRAHLKNGKWTDIEDLSINNDYFSTAHPALNKENTRLYFVSNRPESIGQTDIFYVPIHNNGTLGKVETIANGINTEGRESFPFITENNELYFSSDGHYGLGGYDVFYSKIYEDSFGSPLNVGTPINSAFDDVSFAIKKHKGYISSNRPNGLGHDDIYSFVETKDINDLFKSKIYGVVTNRHTKELMPNTTITITDVNNKVITTIQTNEQGYYDYEVDINKNYIIKATKLGFDGDDVFSKAGENEREHNLELTPHKKVVVPGDDIAKLLNIIIYFDFDKSNIRPDAAVELEKIVAVMKKHPEMKIDIRSHTDSRGNDAYNLALSDSRARSSEAYIINRGIDKSRLKSRGYGETQLVNKCENDVFCSEEEHQENRRSEFIIQE
ncbi:OmpA family protein [Tenacibaculum sediminilitoris]|uniref:OmpA family protein n=1 Tax=Tenacibaculum sediminilitoris TaxID=1820334 RepID=UPI0038B4D2C5